MARSGPHKFPSRGQEGVGQVAQGREEGITNEMGGGMIGIW